jgi:hypothetical protein
MSYFPTNKIKLGKAEFEDSNLMSSFIPFSLGDLNTPNPRVDQQ